MPKFGRNYELQIQASDGSTIFVEPPFTLEFDINRNILSSANTSSIRIMNLAKAKRDVIRKNVNDFDDLRLIQLRAGYGDDMPVIFTGNVNRAWSFREGVNFVSQMECYDGGFAFVNADTQITFPTNTDRHDMPELLIKGMDPKVRDTIKLGAIGNSLQGKTIRANPYYGNTFEILRKIVGNGFFVDNGKLNVLADNEYIFTPIIPVVNAASGLLATPVWEDSIIHFTMLLEPNLIAGQILTLDSQTEPSLNGDFKVISLHHRGTISDAVSGEAITDVGLLAPFRNTELTPIGATT